MKTADQIVKKIDLAISVLKRWVDESTVTAAGPVSYHMVNGKLRALEELRNWILKE